MRRVSSLAVLLLVYLLTATTQGQTGRPVFRAGVELVQIDVSVLDGKRQPVKGLTAADFTVIENGVPRAVKAFAEVTLPPRPAPTAGDAVWAASVPPDVVTNEVGQEDGRLVIILMDRTIPVGEPTVAARKIAAATIDALGPHDLAAVVSTSGGVPQTFTSDRTRLLKAIDQRDWSTDISQEAKEILGSLSAQSEGPSLAPDPLSDGRCLCGLCVLDTISRLADAVRDATGRRKTLFFIGSSVIVQAPLRDPKADVGCDRLLRDARTKMLDALAQSSLTVHSIDPVGIVNVGPQARASSAGGLESTGATSRRAAQQTETNDLLGNQESLGILPERTGGRRVINTNAPEEKVPDIFKETETYYVLAYEPGPAKGTAPRSLEVKVARKGLQVYTQRRVSAPAPAAAAAGAPTPALAASAGTIDDALRGLLPQATRLLAVNLAAVAGIDDARPAVNVRVDARSFLEGRTATPPLEIGIIALDAFGHTVATARQTSTVSVSGAGSTLPADVPVESRLELAPGDYEIRIAVRNPESGDVSSVFAPVTIPSFANASLSISDVVVEASSSASAAPQPTIRRAFKTSERMQATLHVYEGLRRDDDIAPVTVRAQVLDATGRSVHDQTLALTERDFARRRADCRVAIPLDRLSAGDYLLKIDAAADKATASKAIRFRVE
jgi:VWFA-related protein